MNTIKINLNFRTDNEEKETAHLKLKSKTTNTSNKDKHINASGFNVGDDNKEGEKTPTKQKSVQMTNDLT
jgi:hypothetical protein